MSLEGLVFAFLLLKDPQFLQSLPGHARLFKLAFALAAFSVLVEDLEEVLRDEFLWVKCLLFETLHGILGLVALCRIVGKAGLLLLK